LINFEKQRVFFLTLDKDGEEFDPYNILKQFVPSLKDVSKKEFKSIVEKYNIKRIISYINSKINKENTFEGNSFILNLIPIYSELSSFVHGSFGATETISKMAKEEDRIKDMNQALKFSSLIAISISAFSCLIFVKEDKKFALLHKKFVSLFAEYK
jgi:transcriptional regulator of aromatic amino acid metabolism